MLIGLYKEYTGRYSPTLTAPDATNVNLPQHKSYRLDPSPHESALALFSRCTQLRQEAVIKIARAVLMWFVIRAYILFCICYRLAKFVRALVFFFRAFFWVHELGNSLKSAEVLKLFMFVAFNCQVHRPWLCDVTQAYSCQASNHGIANAKCQISQDFANTYILNLFSGLSKVVTCTSYTF